MLLTAFDYFGYGVGGVHGWDSNGTILEGFPKYTEVDAQAAATVSDIDNDGLKELVASSFADYDNVFNTWKKRGSIYVWELSGASTNDEEWPMFHHDPQHTGNYHFRTACQELLDRITAAWGSTCGDPNYDYTADLDNSGTVGGGDLGIWAGHQNDMPWCYEQLNSTENPCT